MGEQRWFGISDWRMGAGLKFMGKIINPLRNLEKDLIYSRIYAIIIKSCAKIYEKGLTAMSSFAIISDRQTDRQTDRRA
jgi:hypothetical protein